MATITLGTFNCENLFTRFRFTKKTTQKAKDNAVQNGFIIDRKLFERVKNEDRKFTASAIKATGADIVGLQEVENLDTLKNFQSNFVNQYPFQYLVDGNDPRLIDVAVLSKLEAVVLRTHQFDKKGNSKIFSRDCLEVEFNISGTPFTLFVNHFKSMLGGRGPTMVRRKTQAERVVQIVKDKFGNNPGNENFAIVGDLNDYMPSTGLAPLLKEPWLENLIATRLPQADQWTHWWDKDNSVSQLDYILLSQRLAANNPNVVPMIVRKGLAKKCTHYMGPRFTGVGNTTPSASDHCAVAVTIDI